MHEHIDESMWLKLLNFFIFPDSTFFENRRFSMATSSVDCHVNHCRDTLQHHVLFVGSRLSYVCTITAFILTYNHFCVPLRITVNVIIVDTSDPEDGTPMESTSTAQAVLPVT